MKRKRNLSVLGIKLFRNASLLVHDERDLKFSVFLFFKVEKAPSFVFAFSTLESEKA